MRGITDVLQRRIWLGPLIGLIVGIGLGLPLGWFTVEWKPGPDDVAAVADSYSLNNDLALARARLHGLTRNDLTRILTNLIRESNARNEPRASERLTNFALALGINISPVALTTPAPTPAPTRSTAGLPTSLLGLVPTALPYLLVFVLTTLVAAAVIILLIRVVPKWRAARAATQPPSAPAPAPAGPASLAGARAAAGGGNDLGHYVASYTLGNDNYDTSFSLETGKQEFLGECGMGISETVGEGKPDKVTAFDLWLFDKADVRTVTQILMSEHAYNDQVLRGKLSAKGAAVLAEKGKRVTLDTQSLHMEAQIVELVYASAPNIPPNSYFQKLTVELVPSAKVPVPA